ncbi:hypothetical protein GCM10028820_31350 [Tessaracoccus terricola]
MDGGCVADGEFVVAGGEAAVVFELVDAAFDGVAVLVEVCVEGGCSSTFGTAAFPVGDLVFRGGDGCADPVFTQPQTNNHVLEER